MTYQNISSDSKAFDDDVNGKRRRRMLWSGRFDWKLASYMILVFSCLGLLTRSPQGQKSITYVRTTVNTAFPLPTCNTLNSTLEGGRWLPRSPPFTALSNFTLGDELLPNWDHECRLPDGGFSSSRTLAAVNWVWTPSTCRMRNWDAEAFLLHLLGMPHGMFLIGDSLTKQFWKAIGSAVGSGEGALLMEEPPTMDEGKEVWPRLRGSDRYFINEKHPFWRRVYEEGRYSRERLQRPVVTKLATYHLVSNELLTFFINLAGGASTIGRHEKLYPYSSDPEFIPTIDAALSAYDLPRGEDDLDIVNILGTDENTIKTLVIIGSGAHYGTARMEGAETREIAEKTFAIAMNYVIEELVTLPNAKERIRLFARTNPVPTEFCANYSEPLVPPQSLPQASYHNARSYPFFDNFFLNDPRLETLDFRPLDGTRPDARRMPPSDCLHLCIHAARNWVYVLWNLL
ncbi:hypothetical protein T439DRAFT_244030 [Meredithblackwellia eburnea MCA 4105]